MDDISNLTSDLSSVQTTCSQCTSPMPHDVEHGSKSIHRRLSHKSYCHSSFADAACLFSGLESVFLLRSASDVSSWISFLMAKRSSKTFDIQGTCSWSSSYNGHPSASRRRCLGLIIILHSTNCIHPGQKDS